MIVWNDISGHMYSGDYEMVGKSPTEANAEYYIRRDGNKKVLYYDKQDEDVKLIGRFATNEEAKAAAEDHLGITKCESCSDTLMVRSSVKQEYRGCLFDFCSRDCKNRWKDEKRNHFKGEEGEKRLSAFLRERLKEDYHILDDVTLPIAYTTQTSEKTTQIDHIIVSTYGVFVVETKNWSGKILGFANDKKWVQKLGEGDDKSYNQLNPLIQNEKHLEAVKGLSNIDEKQMFSLVVFVGDADVKVVNLPENATNLKGSLKYIKSKTKILLNKVELGSTIQKIEASRMPNTKESLRENLNCEEVLADEDAISMLEDLLFMYKQN